MKLLDLQPNKANPRTASESKLKQLKKAMKRFGSLDGIVYNTKTKRLVSGHQRRSLAQESQITITKKYARPTKTGTVAEGYVEIDGSRFPYRAVYWDEATEKAGTIAANKNAGEWDEDILGAWLKELSSLDDFDIELTMFNEEELLALPNPIEVSAHTRTPGEGKEEDPEVELGPSKCKARQVYALGESRLKCGSDDLHYCDKIISRWENYSGQDAVLQKKTKKKIHL